MERIIILTFALIISCLWQFDISISDKELKLKENLYQSALRANEQLENQLNECRLERYEPRPIKIGG